MPCHAKGGGEGQGAAIPAPSPLPHLTAAALLCVTHQHTGLFSWHRPRHSRHQLVIPNPALGFLFLLLLLLLFFLLLLLLFHLLLPSFPLFAVEIFKRSYNSRSIIPGNQHIKAQPSEGQGEKDARKEPKKPE